MSDEAADGDQAASRPGMLERAALRVIDAGLRALQGLRAHFDAPVADADAEEIRERRRPSRSVEAAAEAPAASAAEPNTLWQSLLIGALCLLIGGGGGGLISYLVLTKQLETRQKQIDRLQDDARVARLNETRNLSDKLKLQQDIVDYRRSLREAEQEIDDYQQRLAELQARGPASRGAARAGSGAASAPTIVRPQASRKGGTCVTGTDNPSASVLDCITKFNRP